MTWTQKRFIGAVAALFAAAACIAPVQAQTKDKGVAAFGTGVYIGPQIGYQVGASELDFNAAGFGSIIGINGLSSQGETYGGRAGADYRIPGTPFLIGIVATYRQGAAEFDASIGGTEIVTMSVEPTWAVGPRFAYVLPGDKAMLYGGYQFARADITVSSPLFKTISRQVDGGNIMFGAEMAVAKFVTVGVQWDWTKLEGTNLLPASAAPLRLDLDTEVHAFTLNLNLRLEGLFGQ